MILKIVRQIQFLVTIFYCRKSDGILVSSTISKYLLSSVMFMIDQPNLRLTESSPYNFHLEQLKNTNNSICEMYILCFIFRVLNSLTNLGSLSGLTLAPGLLSFSALLNSSIATVLNIS